MLNFRRLDRNHDAGRATTGIIAPVVTAENVKRLSHGLEQTLRGNLDRVLHALRVPACDPACSDRHRANVAVSCFVR
jgi:hypothetical protein